jgi:hypothetical protein
MNHYFLSSSKEELEIVAFQCFIQDSMDWNPMIWDSIITYLDNKFFDRELYDEAFSTSETGTCGTLFLTCHESYYQQAILDLVHEPLQAKLDQLQSVELQIRQQVLIQILQATSEEEAHLTKLSLDDVWEVGRKPMPLLFAGVVFVSSPSFEN